jgi:carotenoid cleavage dioxygenase-like enzyme
MANTAMKLSSLPAQEPGWHRAFQNLSREHGYEPLRVEGRLPEDLRGTLLRVGPWTFDAYGERYRHWFDGDGGVMGVRFEGGQAQGAARLMETPTIRQERNAGHRLYSAYGTPAPLLRRLFGKVKNAANTSVMAWNGKLYALFEGSVPVELAPEDLSSLGETDFGGTVLGTFSAHPHRVPSRKATYNFGLRFGRETLLDLYELPDGRPARHLGSVPLPGPTMIHDFIVTDRYLVFFLPALRLKVFRLMLGLGAYSDNLEWRPEVGSQVLVVPIDDVSAAVHIDTEAFYQWHFGNAYEEGGRLVVDYVRYPDFETNAWLGSLIRGEAATEAKGRLHRAVVDLEAKTFRTEQRADASCEFPRISPQVSCARHRYVYMAAHSGPAALRGYLDAVSKVDLETGRETRVKLGEEQYPSEPVFVPRAGGTAEDDGWLLVQTFDARGNTSHVAVLDAKVPEAGPVARAHFDHALPFTFHGGFAPTKP